MGPKCIWTNARVVTGASGTDAETLEIAVEDGRITEVGPDLDRSGAEVVNCEGRLLTPAFIDCHTHLVFGGDRTTEFEMRLEGSSYEDIARAGGGIASSMRNTRQRDVETLVREALPRLDALLSEGVSTVEIKSGYGLSIEDELKMLRAARRLAEVRPVRIRTTWLAAHAMPPEFDGSKADYIAEVAIRGLELAHAEGLVDAVDAFCEGIAFSAEEIAPLFDTADALGLPVKLHTEQLSRSGGTALAAKHKALSVDHFEYAAEDEVAAIAASGTVAVLLPGAFYFLRETRLPPVAALRDAGVPMALATDCNPGTSPVSSLLLTMNMGAVLFRMTVAECLAGVTVNAARALGLTDAGQIAPGMSADFAIWNAGTVAQLVGRAGLNPLHIRVYKGEIQGV
ncbi:imidazolonepropionase [Pelagovum pacificum]|uniref:Imidazolonepropionase n=1 Tax=Pelagovum pacificum TaxID=2588711 RepID=A0A5C5GEM7_9RHOB|nr:imidazolonepropionase [Pelagovum pacificum]QQA44224.1 imidazolonepropionase [Pelagovum pacificum]TNY32654.1 imidazolonepropionase [Pelagovum pacificum]